MLLPLIISLSLIGVELTLRPWETLWSHGRVSPRVYTWSPHTNTGHWTGGTHWAWQDRVVIPGRRRASISSPSLAPPGDNTLVLRSCSPSVGALCFVSLKINSNITSSQQQQHSRHVSSESKLECCGGNRWEWQWVNYCYFHCFANDNEMYIFWKWCA